jgi:hypothetical protein
MNEHKRNLDLPHQEPSLNVVLHPTGCWPDGSIETNYLCRANSTVNKYSFMQNTIINKVKYNDLWP